MPEKIGFVGVGRMGANMARRLKDMRLSRRRRVMTSTPPPRNRSRQNWTAPPRTTSNRHRAGGCHHHRRHRRPRHEKDLLRRPADARERQALHQLRHRHARHPRLGGTEMRGQGRAIARSLHGLQHHAGAAGHALSDVRRQAGGVRARQTHPGKTERLAALHRRGGHRRRR